jgi:hypothetical protein
MPAQSSHARISNPIAAAVNMELIFQSRGDFTNSTLLPAKMFVQKKLDTDFTN